MRVAFAGCFWRGFMPPLVNSYAQRQECQTVLSSGRRMFMGFDGFWLGLVTTIGWQAIPIPLVYLTIAAFAGSLAVAVLLRAKASESGKQSADNI